MTPLDFPVWSSLSTLQQGLGEGSDLARRYKRDVNVFIAPRDTSDDALESLSSLVQAGEEGYIMQAASVVIPHGLVVVKEAMGVQMVHTGKPLPDYDVTDIIELSDSDAPEMLALATMTEPGPFRARTHAMGQFWGVRVNGELVAMAGQRMRFPGYIEVSAVCAHPDHRGKGYARRLTALVSQHVLSEGNIPFLHSYAWNEAAIKLYESLGFETRSSMHVVALTRADER